MDERGCGGGLNGAQAQVQRAGEQVVIAVGVRVAVLGRRAGRVQHVGRRIEVRVKTEVGKVFL